MKSNIYIKILITFLMCFSVFVVGFFNFSKSIVSDIVDNAAKTITQGALIYTEKQLILYPQSYWAAVLRKYADNNIKIISMDNLHLTSMQKNQLDNGEIIFQSGATYQFLNEVIVEHTAYKKIGNTTYVLSYFFANPEEFVSYYTSLTRKLIVKDLLANPDNKWNEEVLKLTREYGFPIFVYKSNNRDLPSHIIHDLSAKSLVFEADKRTSRIETIYYTFTGGIVKIGPLNYLPISGRITDAMNYFIFTFFILAVIFILFFSLLFVRNMKKIYHLTENFSHGNFNFQTKIGSTSVLYGLNENINIMGEKLQNLIETHKRMCRFVAHEIRTPLSTMQMAIDNIKDGGILNTIVEEKINSIQEDIDDLNNLVGTFLVYSQLQTQNLTLNKVKLNIVAKLQELVSKYHVGELTILFKENFKSMEISVDEKLFKHAINNLITNAIKFAKKNIIISVERINDFIAIQVDDDGIGFPEELTEEIFLEYSCAENTEYYDKHIGLGLAIVKKIVLLHDGSVRAMRSPLLPGARFSVLLPII